MKNKRTHKDVIKNNVPNPTSAAFKVGAADAQNKEFKDKLCKLQEETQTYMYSQSSKFSDASRGLIIGIIGTVWIMSFKENVILFANKLVFISFIFGLIYLAVDVIHYYSDTLSYYREIKALDVYKTIKDLNDKHEPQMDKVFERSHSFIVWKLIFLIASAAFLIIGLCLCFFK